MGVNTANYLFHLYYGGRATQMYYYDFTGAQPPIYSNTGTLPPGIIFDDYAPNSLGWDGTSIYTLFPANAGGTRLLKCNAVDLITNNTPTWVIATDYAFPANTTAYNTFGFTFDGYNLYFHISNSPTIYVYNCLSNSVNTVAITNPGGAYKLFWDGDHTVYIAGLIGYDGSHPAFGRVSAINTQSLTDVPAGVTLNNAPPNGAALCDLDIIGGTWHATAYVYATSGTTPYYHATGTLSGGTVNLTWGAPTTTSGVQLSGGVWYKDDTFFLGTNPGLRCQVTGNTIQLSDGLMPWYISGPCYGIPTLPAVQFYDAHGNPLSSLSSLGQAFPGFPSVPTLLYAVPGEDTSNIHVFAPSDPSLPVNPYLQFAPSSAGPWTQTLDLGAAIANTLNPFYVRSYTPNTFYRTAYNCSIGGSIA